ncbi:hypothetical protein [Nocardioides sp.]|uniref:hypothetical protein n=1 Tax=Nocardioides sp. TaxID=35761 RepID=UPI00261D2F2E|nr:hypothetical protein [Nocardioides sp.]
MIPVRLSLAAQATGGVDDLVRELQISMVNKLHQIDETLDRMLSEAQASWSARPSQILPLIVNGAGSSISGVVEQGAVGVIEAERWRRLARDPRVLQPAVMGLDDLERAASMAHAGQANFGSLVAQWRRSELAGGSFSYWLWNQCDRGALSHLAPKGSPSHKLLTGARANF